MSLRHKTAIAHIKLLNQQISALMIRQVFDYMLLVHHKILEDKLVELSWVLIDAFTGAPYEAPITYIIYENIPPFQRYSLEYGILCLYQIVVNQEKLFKSVVFMTYGSDLFEKILVEQFIKKGLTLPTIFYSFLDIINEFQLCYGKKVRDLRTITEMALYVGEHSNMNDIVCLGNIVLAMLRRGHIFKEIVQINRVTRARNNNNPSSSKTYKYFKLRGIPFKATKKELLHFLNVQSLRPEDIQFLFTGDRFSGNAVVRVEAGSASNVSSKHQKTMANRYIEVIQVEQQDFDKKGSRDRISSSRSRSRNSSRIRNKKRNKSQDSSVNYSDDKNIINFTEKQLKDMGIVKMRGLPFACSQSQIYDFFERYKPIKNSLKFLYRDGRKSGQALILFNSRQQAKDTLVLDRKKIGARYIELSTTSGEEYSRA